jgi:hypothetical protein
VPIWQQLQKWLSEAKIALITADKQQEKEWSQQIESSRDFLWEVLMKEGPPFEPL